MQEIINNCFKINPLNPHHNVIQKEIQKKRSKEQKEKQKTK